MAQIEPGEYFVVTRGFRLQTANTLSLSTFDIGAQPQRDSEPHYDRSHEGLIYYAEEVCGDMVAAKCVAVDGHHHWKQQHIGKTVSLNTSEVEVFPVTEKYVQAVTSAERQRREGCDD